jgi:cob(I)alamin adenosyltransferase
MSTDLSDQSTTLPLEDNPAEDKSGYAKSIVVLNTGDGKGKSTAAFGIMIRGLARGWDVAVVQFIKSGDWNVGEEKIGRQLGVDWHNEGEGFTWNSDDLEHDKTLARQGWEKAAALIASGDHQLILLDELTYLINWGWLDPEPVYEAIKNRPDHVSLVITGRDAPQGLIDVADTVSEVVKVKHAYDTGILAKKGIDY